ncbi:M14 family metallopeptidase [Aureimonas psammosilenae]|uniref:peptidase M14 n=1 Tax=Aureimonas psammosilenae TaxID=2495496 RepID=UPI001260878A|nr:peptidase M14 [Aureimonas psammosilenae]
MTLLLDTTFPRTIETLLDRFETQDADGSKLQAWTFDDAPTRRAAEARLACVGVKARIRSAYKPLLHFFLEEVEREGLDQIVLRYPVHPAAAPNRFRLEAYPLAALIGNARLIFEANETLDLAYDVHLRWRNGHESRTRILAPNRTHVDPYGTVLLSPTGWLRVDATSGGERLETDFEQLFAAAMAAVSAHDWGDAEPFFAELNLRATLPFAERRLPVGEECVSLGEALHEDLYFSILELFGHRRGLTRDARDMRPGQIVPEVTFAPGHLTLRIETRPLSTDEPPGNAGPAEEAAGPLSAQAVARELEEISGLAFEARSRAGRTVRARYREGSDRAVMISGGQHANEASGIVGALRAAKVLAARPNAHFTVSPAENPDGQALHLRLSQDNPRHMHHAARYTAFGDDLDVRAGDDPHERAIRTDAERRVQTLLHVNLHGYPAHEWTRPLSGYVPQGFGSWTLPRGFFLIMRYHMGWEAPAEALMRTVTQRLSRLPGLMAFNQAQLALYRAHSGEPGFALLDGFPCSISQDDRYAPPMTLITEYPDETIQGPGFAAAHAAQSATVLAAYDALQTLDLASRLPAV